MSEDKHDAMLRALMKASMLGPEFNQILQEIRSFRISFLHIDKEDIEDLIRLGFQFQTRNITFRREELKDFLKANPLIAHEDINEVKRRFKMLKEEATKEKTNSRGLE